MAITGIIRPPPEIRAVADKTAAYVAKNGRAFETKIMNSARGKTPKFAFLHQTSPFRAYYEDRIQFYANGGTDDDTEKQEGAAKPVEEKSKTATAQSSAVVVKKKEKTQKASAIDPIAKALLTQRSKIVEAKARLEEEREKEKNEDSIHPATKRITFDMALPPPPPLELATIVAPFNLTQTQIETIQLVAQFTAMDGKGGPFLHQLTLREWSNPEFSFCQPRHAHFAYFSALVDAYRKILREWVGAAASKEEMKPEEAKESSEKRALEVLDEAAFRAEYKREMKLQMSQQQQEEGEISAIDWNDFVVVETIDFPADEMVEAMLPPPPPTELDVAGPASAATTAAGVPKRADDAMDESSDEEDQGETIRVVPSYTPKVVGASDLSTARAIDPITGKSVAVADMPEHMRIQLLDPKWAEERKKFQEKQKDSNLVSGDAVVANISRLAQSREKVVASSKPIASAAMQANTAKRAMELPPVTTATSAVAAASSQFAEPAAKRPRLDMPPAASAIPPPPQTAAPTESVPEAFEEAAPADTEEKKLMSEEEFAASLSSPDVKLQVRVPNDSAQMAWNFYGQLVSLSVSVMTTVKVVKAQLSKTHLNDMPANKILLKEPNGGFLSNNATLASLNIGPTATLEMSLKQRGGRK